MRLINAQFCEWAMGSVDGYKKVPDDFEPLCRKALDGKEWIWDSFEKLTYLEVEIPPKSYEFAEKYNQVDELRRKRYQYVVAPLLQEAALKRMMDEIDEALALELQAVAARKEIQKENPWPVNVLEA